MSNIDATMRRIEELKTDFSKSLEEFEITRMIMSKNSEAIMKNSFSSFFERIRDCLRTPRQKKKRKILSIIKK